MNFIRNLWNQVVQKTSTTPELSIVKNEPQCTASEIFECILEADGASPWFWKLVAPAHFEKWYKGDLTEAAIRIAIPEFLQDHPSISNRIGEEYQ